MFYDFHIHSCLSPCSDNQMTPNNIVQMALIKNLDWIAVCDHNSCKQQKSVHDVAKKTKLNIMYGVEVQTSEEVHMCCYFLNYEQCQLFQDWIDSKLIVIKNNAQFFGDQLILDEFDEVIETESNLLITSLNASLNTCIEEVHRLGGKVVLAHVLDRVNSITHQLGFIPKDCMFDGLEIKNDEQKNKILTQYPWIKNTMWFINSDAHQLIDISEANHFMSESAFKEFWGIEL